MTTETQSPREIDEKLADIYGRQQRADQYLQFSFQRIQRTAEPNARYVGRSYTPKYELSLIDALAKVQTIADNEEIPSYTRADAAKALEDVEKYRVELKALAAEAKPFNDEFDRRGGWSRFFLVTSSNGHIHRNLSCSTCRINTAYAWLPSVSGKSEAEAVAEHGTRLCTVCYPSAPVEWTIYEKPVDPKTCAGVGKDATEVTSKWAPYGRCPECQGVFGLVGGGKLRKHNKPKAKKSR